MTKLRIMSDLHLEFGPLDLKPIGEDVLVLAGDVGIYTQGAEWALAYARRNGVPAVMVAGNHEFYRRQGDEYTVGSTLLSLAIMAERSGGALTFLDDEVEIVAGVVFAGTTLWTDYALDGDSRAAMMIARYAMNDHRLI